MAAKITKGQRDILLGNIAYLIVNKKNELVLAMQKSGIATVSNKTPNKTLSRIVVEELKKNKKFAKSLADMITDANLKQSMSATGENEQGVDVKQAVDLSAKIYEGISGLADMFGLNKKTREDSKAELDKIIEQEEKDKTTQDGLENQKKVAGKFTTTGVVLSVLGATAIIALSIILYKKYAK